MIRSSALHSTFLWALLGPAGLPAAGASAAGEPGAEEARRVAAEIAGQAPPSAASLLARARIEHRSGGLEAALKLFGEALRLQHSLAEAGEAREARGDILTAWGRAEDALAEYSAALGAASRAAGGDGGAASGEEGTGGAGGSRTPEEDRSRLALKRGQALLSLGRLEEAATELAEAAAAHPREGALRFARAQALLDLGRPREARAEAGEARRLGDRSAALEYLEARALFLLGDRAGAQEALARYRAARRAALSGTETRERREADRRRLDRRNAALAHLDAALLHPPASRRRSHLERALEIDPGLHPARFHLAVLLSDSGDLEAAAAQYERLLREVPDPAPLHLPVSALYQRRVRELLGRPEEARGRVDEALVWARRAVELDPGPGAHETAAWAHLAAGDLAGGREHLRQAASRDPGNPEHARRLRDLEEGRLKLPPPRR